MYVVVSNSGTSMYNLSCIVCFECFLLVGVCCINDKFQILYIWTPYFTLVRPLVLMFSNVFLLVVVF
jgi:hypothetical protein